MMQTFTIKGALPGLNEIISASNSGPHVANRLKQQESVRVAWYAKAARLAPVSGPVTVHFHWIEPNRRRDPDNIRAGSKFILDVLQPQSSKHPYGLGIIESDGHKHIAGLSDSYDFDTEHPGVVVTIEAVE